MSDAVRTAARAVRGPRPVRAHCELDDWTFDPRYTDGRCPICGWQPPGAPSAPVWVLAARKFEWELTGLFLLLVVLVILGAAVAAAAGYRLPLFRSHPPAPAVTHTSVTHASGARTGTPTPHTSASPSHHP